MNYDLNEKISFSFYINLLNFGLSLNLRSDYDTDFGTVGKLYEFMNDIDKATKFLLILVLIRKVYLFLTIILQKDIENTIL